MDVRLLEFIVSVVIFKICEIYRSQILIESAILSLL